jgi:hypothetical protein
VKLSRTGASRAALFVACSVTAIALSSPACASGAANPTSTVEPVETLDIVTNNGPAITPGPGSVATGANYANSPDVLSLGVNGVGQMISITLPYINFCSGTLINPRTVITAAHCVYEAPKEYYGSNTGVGGGIVPGFGLATTNGIPLSFGFASTNRCTGSATSAGNGCRSGTGAYEGWRDSGFNSVASRYIYNANQVWYGLGSAPADFGGSEEFANEDIALVTLDTHVKNVPTWTLLFSPLTGPTHSTITGYGGAGVGTSGKGDLAGIDYRRRSAENMIDALMSVNDFVSSDAINPGSTAFANETHPIYWNDFDDPNFSVAAALANPNFFHSTAPKGSRNNGYYDFNGLGGTALPHEGSTAGGDSGGPLIVDQTFRNPDGSFKPVVAGVLTGSFSFNGGLATYGQFNVYPPLFAFWQEIVANNPYKYVSAKAGNGDWFDPSHWVQDMDPNYAIIGADGQLVNSLPSHPQVGADGQIDKFGRVCFLGFDCQTFNGPDNPADGGTPLITAGGPGSTNFVPNNVEPVNSLDPTLYTKARYYDVTLNKAGRTSLSASAIIDKFTIDGQANLNVTGAGNLKVWAEYNQLGGWTNVDGSLTSSESLIVQGLLSGSGTFDPTYLTVVGGIVAPGTMTPSGQSPVGTLTIKGDVVLASQSTLAIDLMKTKSDVLNVVADADNTGILALNGGSIYFGQGNGAAVRDGQSFTVASAQGGVDGTFGAVLANLGVLQPTVSYTANGVNVSLKAGSLAKYLGTSNSTALAFASALDALRAGSYSKLSNLYGNVDLMNPSQVAATFNSLAPSIINETELLQDRQSRQLLGNVSDRLSLLGTDQASGLSFSGAASPLMGGRATSPQAILGLSSAGRSVAVPLGSHVSGFVSISGDNVRSSYGDQRGFGSGQHSRYYASGVEAPFGAVRVGTAVGYAESVSQAGLDSARSKLTQAAAYASVPLGGGAYVGGIVAAEQARSSSNRLGIDTVSTFRLNGAAHSSRYMATAEAGFRSSLGRGLSINPRAQLGYSRYALDGFHEEGGETALDLNSLKVNRLEARFGAKLNGSAHIAGWTVSPRIQADYVRLVSGGRNGLNVSFAAAPDYAFALPLTNSGRGWAEVKGGVSMSRGAFTLGLSGQATAGDAPISDQRGLVSLGVKF